MKIRYQVPRFFGATMKMIDQANGIIQQYQEQGLVLTLRQVYYQFVSRDLLPNTERSYKNLGRVLNEARLAGLVDWEAMEDRTRFLRKLPTWSSPTSILASCADQFRYDKWANQPAYVEVFIEKDALIGVIEGVCEKLEVPYLACRGYASASEIWRAGHQRFKPRAGKKKLIILYLGDHDPSGMDMTRDVKDRINTFAGRIAAVEVKRLALNFDQVEEYQPPPNPTKLTDSRATAYIEEFGNECWELDALEPTVIGQLITDACLSLLDQKAWKADVKREKQAREQLGQTAGRWQEVMDFLDA